MNLIIISKITKQCQQISELQKMNVLLQIGPLPVSPWRWAYVWETLSWMNRCQQRDSCWQPWWSRCCCLWTPAGWWYLPLHSGEHCLSHWLQGLCRRCLVLMWKRHTNAHMQQLQLQPQPTSAAFTALLCFCYLTQVFCGLSKLGQFPDEAWGLLVVGAEGEDSLVGGVGGGSAFAGQRGVVEGEGLGLDCKTSGEFIIQHATGCLRRWSCC